MTNFAIFPRHCPDRNNKGLEMFRFRSHDRLGGELVERPPRVREVTCSIQCRVIRRIKEW